MKSVCPVNRGVCSLRWALSQQGGSERPKNLWYGSLWSKRSWATTGSALTCSAWEPAACWLTSRGRWGLSAHTHMYILLLGHMYVIEYKYVFGFVLVCTDLPSCDWTICSLSWAAYGVKLLRCCSEDQWEPQAHHTSLLLLIQAAHCLLIYSVNHTNVQCFCWKLGPLSVT